MKNKIKKMFVKSLKHDKMKKEGKKFKGFTLVELIVVIAIIGILAAILVPTLMGRVKQSRITTANDGAVKLAEQAAIIISDYESQGISTAAYKGGYYSVSSDSLSGELKDDLITVIPSLQNSQWAVYFSDKGSLISAVCRDNSSSYVGMYPIKSDEDNAAIGDVTGEKAGSDLTDKMLEERLKIAAGNAWPEAGGGTPDPAPAE